MRGLDILKNCKSDTCVMSLGEEENYYGRERERRCIKFGIIDLLLL
jgi:hypothetical protein